MGVGWQQPFPLWRHLTCAREWGSELRAGEGGQNLPPSNSALMKAMNHQIFIGGSLASDLYCVEFW